MLAAERCHCRVGEGKSHHSVVRSVQSRIPTVLLAGRRTGPVFLTDRNAKPSVALVDLDLAGGVSVKILPTVQSRES